MVVVDLGFGVRARFKTEDEARQFCDKYLEKTGDVLTIRKVNERQKNRRSGF